MTSQIQKRILKKENQKIKMKRRIKMQKDKIKGKKFQK
jgi:hypothetical protein